MEKDIDIAIFVLRSGGTIIYPTDTLWGIGCDATDDEAVQQVIDLKKRVSKDGMIILVDDPKMIKNYVEEIPKEALDILKKEKDPVTIIYPKAKNLPSNLIAEDGSVGIRITKNEFCKELIRRFKKPLVSTSANYSGTDAPASFKDIDVNLICDVDYVVKWEQENENNTGPSKIIKISENGTKEVIRES